jgi:hypothetical protein
LILTATSYLALFPTIILWEISKTRSSLQSGRTPNIKSSSSFSLKESWICAAIAYSAWREILLFGKQQERYIRITDKEYNLLSLNEL